MIETIEGARRAEEILSVKGVDSCVIGPGDLALSMSVSRGDIGTGTEYEAVVASVLRAGESTLCVWATAEHTNTRMMSRRHISHRPRVAYHHKREGS